MKPSYLYTRCGFDSKGSLRFEIFGYYIRESFFSCTLLNQSFRLRGERKNERRESPKTWTTAKKMKRMMTMAAEVNDWSKKVAVSS